MSVSPSRAILCTRDTPESIVVLVCWDRPGRTVGFLDQHKSGYDTPKGRLTHSHSEPSLTGDIVIFLYRWVENVLFIKTYFDDISLE